MLKGDSRSENRMIFDRLCSSSSSESWVSNSGSDEVELLVDFDSQLLMTLASAIIWSELVSPSFWGDRHVATRTTISSMNKFLAYIPAH
jgi:hypothetical protein